jgi:hypothetical protein
MMLILVLACASVDGADQGTSTPNADASPASGAAHMGGRASEPGDASPASGATHTGGRASEPSDGSTVSGGAAGATAPLDADLPCDCSRPCPLDCDLREEVKPSHLAAFDWPCGEKRDDDFLLECYRPYAADALVLIGRCEYIGVRYTSHRMYTDWYDAVTHELVGWEVWDPTMPLSPFMCYGAIPPPPWECDGPVCTVSCSRPDASCDLSDLTVDADPM